MEAAGAAANAASSTASGRIPHGATDAMALKILQDAVVYELCERLKRICFGRRLKSLNLEFQSPRDATRRRASPVEHLDTPKAPNGPKTRPRRREGARRERAAQEHLNTIYAPKTYHKTPLHHPRLQKQSQKHPYPRRRTTACTTSPRRSA